MKPIFQKIKFPEAPGGNLYEWADAETSFATMVLVLVNK